MCATTSEKVWAEGQGTMASVGAEPQEFRTPPRGHWYLGDLKGSTAVLSDCSWEPQHPKSETPVA